jgi:hypothetical protein
MCDWRISFNNSRIGTNETSNTCRHVTIADDLESTAPRSVGVVVTTQGYPMRLGLGPERRLNGARIRQALAIAHRK